MPSIPGAGFSTQPGIPSHPSGIPSSFLSMGTISNSSCFARKRLILPSFSAGAKVQVEYTSLPPGTSIRAAHSRMPSCLSAQSCTFSGLHSSQATSFFRNIPSPEQGASTRIRSKYSSKISARCSGVSFNTQALRMPMRSTFSESIFALAGWISFVTSSPSPSIADAIWVLFPPGAAHRSRIRSPGCGDSSVTGAMALGS